MKTVKDLQDELYGHKNVGIAMVIKEALDNVMNNNNMTPDTELTIDILEEIRQELFKLRDRPKRKEEMENDALLMLMSAFSGNSGDNYGDSVLYIESIMNKFRPPQ